MVCGFSLGSFIHRTLAKFHIWDLLGILKNGLEMPSFPSPMWGCHQKLDMFLNVTHTFIWIAQAISKPYPKHGPSHLSQIYWSRADLFFNAPG